MIEADRAGWRDLGRAPCDWLERLQGAFSDLNACFGSWRDDGGDEDQTAGADPEVVAALECLASILPDDED
ncbi:MAG: hypothetical protein ACM3US_02355 [Sphingomonadaceae bacterium]